MGSVFYALRFREIEPELITKEQGASNEVLISNHFF